MSNQDKFELHQTIKKLERQRSILVVVYLCAIGAFAGSWLFDLAHGDLIVCLLILCVGGSVHREIVEARLDTVRSSLRNVLISRDPSILDDPDY